MTEASSTKPYLLRAIYEWAVDNGFTPQILVDAIHESVVVPREHVKDGQIVLNIHPQSVQNISLGNDYVMCSARFSGRAFELTVPVFAILAIYARENGQGIVFQEDNQPPEPNEDEDSPVTPGSDPAVDPGNSHLKLVK